MDILQESAIKFCKAHPQCSACEIGAGADTCLVRIIAEKAVAPEETIAKVLLWAREHPEPIRTYADEFFEHFPNAANSAYSSPTRRIPWICVQSIHPDVKCGGDCIACWSKPCPKN